jgi:23S rRNA (cytidine1920-2'-O)/16S rRNA (cytidine1409-2'-O)-methyltransferase
MYMIQTEQKLRLDKALRHRGLCKSRSMGEFLIETGKILVNGEVCERAALLVGDEDVIVVSEQLRYVSRGGLKLEHALQIFGDGFGLDVSGLTCLDVGASTGGFTDCMLQHGAKRVYAVDVGTGQLDERLYDDKRIISLEQCDVREVSFEEKLDFAAVDVSFISLKLIFPHLWRLRVPKAVVLIKPQFELGRAHKGVVKDDAELELIVKRLVNLAEERDFHVRRVVESPFAGKDKNCEFLMYLEAKAEQS